MIADDSIDIMMTADDDDDDDATATVHIIARVAARWRRATTAVRGGRPRGPRGRRWRCRTCCNLHAWRHQYLQISYEIYNNRFVCVFGSIPPRTRVVVRVLSLLLQKYNSIQTKPEKSIDISKPNGQRIEVKFDPGHKPGGGL